MSYRTYALGGEDFIVNPILENVEFSVKPDQQAASYSIKAKIKPETPFSEILELIEAGMTISVTIAGKKRILRLE